MNERERLLVELAKRSQESTEKAYDGLADYVMEQVGQVSSDEELFGFVQASLRVAAVLVHSAVGSPYDTMLHDGDLFGKLATSHFNACGKLRDKIVEKFRAAGAKIDPGLLHQQRAAPAATVDDSLAEAAPVPDLGDGSTEPEETGLDALLKQVNSRGGES